jgi:hypothetical protein
MASGADADRIEAMDATSGVPSSLTNDRAWQATVWFWLALLPLFLSTFGRVVGLKGALAVGVGTLAQVVMILNLVALIPMMLSARWRWAAAGLSIGLLMCVGLIFLASLLLGSLLMPAAWGAAGAGAGPWSHPTPCEYS